MDRNTITGLILIGVLLSAFAIFNQPSEEDRKKMEEKARQDQEAKNKKKDSDKKKAKADDDAPKRLEANWVQNLDANNEPVAVDSGMVSLLDTITGNDTIVSLELVPMPKKEKVATKKTPEIKDSLITLESDKLIVTFNAKGGMVSEVRLKEYESYDDFAKKDGKLTPLTLFKSGDAMNEVILPMGDKKIHTSKLKFDAKVNGAKNRVVFEYRGKEKELIRFSYGLKKGKYDLDYDIEIQGYGGKVTPSNVMYRWRADYQRTERLASEQRRVSTICYQYKNEGFSYLSEVSTDYEEAEDAIDWVGFKQSYFSSIIRPDKPFGKSGSKMKIKTFAEGSKDDAEKLKGYKSTLNLNLSNTNNASVHMSWYFGPNEYKELHSYDAGYDGILNYGWGIFRWINLYAVQPLFNMLQGWGLAAGIAILLLTIILKLALMPIQWKMYTSSAKMRILKPEIEELNNKYPEKEDAMKKQMEMMTLYKESGASPLAGCVPMLIQMPILLAVFRFFPSTFDLRQKSFLWAEDLSSYDSIYTFGFDIPFYGDHISLFTLLMAGTTLIYTFINSSNMSTPQQPGMPNMKVIMYFFPIMMIFFFNNYASGLSYYYFISTLASILIMISIKKFFVDEDKLKEKMAARKAAAGSNGGDGKKGKGKSKFQERLEQMQKAQMEQRKNRGKK